ncbi:MAG: hemerythrin protein [Frankiales bacterium]|nr:hemerythrin protein [Frankiales bacterium]
MTSTLPLADTRDMIGLHQVFRDALAAPYLSETRDGDTARVELVGSYLDNVLRLLHAHHEGEDELMTPRVLARCTPEEAAVVGEIAAMHEGVTEDLAAAESALAAWRRSAAADDREQAVARLEQLRSTVTLHLDREEREVLPIASKYVDVAEWGELPAHGMRTFTGDKQWLIIGLVQEQMPAPAIAAMESNMPPPVLAMWRSSGRAAAAEFLARLRG